MSFLEDQLVAWSEIRERFSHNETPNGPGSTISASTAVRQALPSFIQTYDTESILDVPCGDWNWMQYVDLDGIDYTGWDSEQQFIDRNAERWPQHTFERVNILRVRTLPNVDLILCRDFLIHVPNDYALKVIDKFIDSGSRFLLTTTHPGADNTVRVRDENGHDNRPGYFCWDIDLDVEPFNLKPARIARIEEASHQELALYDLAHV